MKNVQLISLLQINCMNQLILASLVDDNYPNFVYFTLKKTYDGPGFLFWLALTEFKTSVYEYVLEFCFIDPQSLMCNASLIINDRKRNDAETKN